MAVPRARSRAPTGGVVIAYWPICLDLRGRRALVLGAGEAADRKADALERSGAAVSRAERFAPGLLEGVAVAIGAEAPEADLQALAAAARAAGIPVNVVDRPDLCGFITPAIVARGRLTIAISSGGAAPMLARAVRGRIEALLAPELDRVADWLDDLKEELRRRFPDARARRRVIEALLEGPATLVAAGREADARAAAEAVMAGLPANPVGLVSLVGAGPGAADLLTLRAQRRLGEADVIVHDRDVAEAVLDLARRDARRVAVDGGITPDEVTALVLGLARAGNRVVRLTPGEARIEDARVQTWADAGIPCELVPGVPSR